MLLEQKRECECEKNMQENMQMPAMEEREEAEKRMNCELRRQMIDKIRGLEFAINELALYLDTHPEDTKALCLHRRYCKELKELKDKYQKIYGPLTINYPCNKWRWLEEPWPWFILGKLLIKKK